MAAMESVVVICDIVSNFFYNARMDLIQLNAIAAD